ncbi:hypothetical protein ACJ6WF_21030 [Streptomyces sp. MMS24-I2-30]|uniref:hypothetical protein n=1 Tax=Streptomyces sp. MMS24-I2-30 TaxID=3351564 RepID=UPI00389693D1
MCTADARADELMACLSAAGFSPRRYDHGEYVVVEMEVRRPLPAEGWKELYELLETVAGWGGRWGLVNKRDGLIAHASIRKTPAAHGCPGERPSALGS